MTQVNDVNRVRLESQFLATRLDSSSDGQMTRLDSSHCKPKTQLDSSHLSKRLYLTRVNARKTCVPKRESLFLCEKYWQCGHVVPENTYCSCPRMSQQHAMARWTSSVFQYSTTKFNTNVHHAVSQIPTLWLRCMWWKHGTRQKEHFSLCGSSLFQQYLIKFLVQRWLNSCPDLEKYIDTAPHLHFFQ